MPKGMGYAISAQKSTGGSEVHNRMKNKILGGKEAGDTASAAFNKKMYKSKTGLDTGNKMSKGKMSY